MTDAVSRRWFAIGDPQTRFATYLGILRANGLLGDGDRLREDVGLIAIGDYFDFNLREQCTLAESSQDGIDILRWLASHPPEQTVIIIGNHDTSRVMELAFETDESFAAARRDAAECVKEDPPGERTRAFGAAYPNIGTPQVAHRDFNSFTVAQRALVQELLLANRMHLAWVGTHGGEDILFTHASVSQREVDLLGAAATPAAIASALQARLHDAVAKVRGAWQRGELAALDLSPLHYQGRDGREGGGLLYHRPSSRVDRSGPDAPLARRRYHPSELPRLAQLCGHTGHKKCREELAEWYAEAASPRLQGCLRTLTVADGAIVYREGIQAPGDATLFMIDAEMNAPDMTDYPLFQRLP